MIGPYNCYACGKRTKGTRSYTLTAVLVDDDGRRVPVGPDCQRRIKAADVHGFEPPKGGPRLFFTEEWRLNYLKTYSLHGPAA